MSDGEQLGQKLAETINAADRELRPLPLPRYKCHKEVRALEIAQRCYRFAGSEEVWTDERLVTDSRSPSGVRPATDWGLMPVDPRFGPIWVGAAWVARHNPQPGGFYVLYEDGYSSFSPGATFKAGYTAIEEAIPELYL